MIQKLISLVAITSIFFLIHSSAAPVYAACTYPEVSTAIGCISSTPEGLIGSILNIAIGIGGGIAFILILFGGFQILTSAGNPEQLAAGRELVTSAVTGLLLIIFSIFLLRLIGVDILGIPDFGN